MILLWCEELQTDTSVQLPRYDGEIVMHVLNAESPVPKQWTLINTAVSLS